jgi:hypothetical protein
MLLPKRGHFGCGNPTSGFLNDCIRAVSFEMLG